MKVVTASQMMNIEKQAINNYGIPSILLMENAALAILGAIYDILGDLKGKRIVILAGKGNNGGDGLALGRHLFNRGAEVKVFLCGKEGDLKPDSKINFKLLKGLGTTIFLISSETELRAFKLALLTSDLAVDALFGTGFRGALPAVEESYVKALNESGKPIVAVDIASGLDASNGLVYKEAVNAKITVTFGLPKLGHYLGKGPECSGELRIDKISIPDSLLDEQRIETNILTNSQAAKLIPVRTVSGHKGTHGMCLIIGGSLGMTGAVALVAKGALRSGAGLVRMGVASSVAPHLDSMIWEATTISLLEKEAGVIDPMAVLELSESFERSGAVAFGPGMSQNGSVRELLAQVIYSCSKPLVIDADGLNALAEDLKILSTARGPIILTPHPGEMARLTGLTIQEVTDNKLELARKKAVEWNVVLVLKGASTLVVAPDGRAFLNPTGNPLLGTGGTGDVLTGCIAGFLAQGASPLDAACLGVFTHGLAGDLLAEGIGMRGALAHEVADFLPNALREIEIKGNA